MFVSYRWLGRHVDLTGISPEELADDLTLSTAEVEGIERFAPHMNDVVVGFVKERVQHPDADKLSVCTVDVGGGEPLGIVCGANNVDAGQKVAVARVGTVLPGDFKLKKSKIRGVASEGMICSERELELGDDHSGIWVLPDDAEVGRPVADAIGMEDWVIEIDNKSLTHRPDLWGHRGIAAEVAAIYRRELRPVSFDLPPTGDETPYPIRIESADCPRYIGLRIEGAESRRSPEWMRWLLLAVGQRPLDLIVDLSNFVMLDLGQPNHTFDLSGLSPEGIVVRNAREKETMATLDGEERKLVPTDLLICSGDAPVALAGVMGGEGSKVEEGTTGLLLEIANFHPAVVRRTSARIGLRTDASARFEKSLDPTLPMRAAGHFANLLKELSPGVSFPAPPTDVGEWSDPSKKLTLRPNRVRTLLGQDVTDDEIEDILTRLGFGVARNGESMEVAVPSVRATRDIGIEQDLVEEVGRIYRYGNIPERKMMAEVEPPPRDDRRALVRRIQDRLAGAAHFHEVISYSFQDDADLAKLGLAGEPYVTVTNAVVEGQAKVRRAVLPSLLAIVGRNRRQQDDVRLFEIGKGYLPECANERGEPAEVHQLAVVWASTPAGKKARFDASRLARLHGVVDDLFRHLGLADPAWSSVDGGPAWSHPAKALAATWEGATAPAAIVCELEPGVARAIGLEGDLASDVAVAEISLDALLAAPGRPPGYRPIPRYPGVKVDVAVALDAATPAGDVVDVIERAGKGIVQDIELFDLYRGENLGAGKKSLAYHVLLQSEKKTLSDKDGQKFLSRLERMLGEAGGELRKG